MIFGACSDAAKLGPDSRSLQQVSLKYLPHATLSCSTHNIVLIYAALSCSTHNIVLTISIKGVYIPILICFKSRTIKIL